MPGKIRGLLPYQPVYSKEMADRIEKIENEKIDKIVRSNRPSFSFQPLLLDVPILPLSNKKQT